MLRVFQPQRPAPVSALVSDSPGSPVPLRSIAVFDFGSQYSQLIVRRIRELGYHARLHPPAALRAVAEAEQPAAVILSGGPRSTTEPDAPDIDFGFLRGLGVPVLGICYGMQLLNLKWGGRIHRRSTREYGPALLCPTAGDGLMEGVGESQVWMSHSDTCERSPEARVLAENQDGVPVALAWGPDCFGIQFHPEVSHSVQGERILANFLAMAREPARFEIGAFKDELVARVRETVAGRSVVCGVSGGVDSTVLAALLHAAGVNVRCLFVDNGLLRQGEAEEVVAQFGRIGIAIEVVDAADRFLDALAGVTDPEEKRRIIGRLFVEVFFDAAGEIELLAQGTLYPDVIESATSGSIASTIKTHHNRVTEIMELAAQRKVLEPLAELFKDEVRALGRALGLAEDVLGRHPFPGPGLAVRCPGAVTRERLELIRQADAIFIGALRRHGLYDLVWQAYAAALPCPTVGVKGDERVYETPVVLRAVASADAMTAEWVRLPAEFLAEVSNRILNGVPGVSRVLYDISTKPPASIEWE
jgi:GMP synthase (glutamine-hydrolysing)